MSVTSQTIRNDSVVMDISTVANNVMPVVTKNAPPPQEKVVNFKPISKMMSNPIPADEKENIAVLDDMDLTLDLPPPAPPTKSFSSKTVPAIFSSSLRPSFSNSTAKISMVESSGYGEKTSGSDNMDISGIEPTDQNEVHIVASTIKRESEYSKWLKNDKNFTTKKQQKSTNQIVDIQLDDTPVNVLPTGRPKAEVGSRKTINQPFEMSLEVKNQTQLKDVSGSLADMSIEAQPEQLNRRHKTVDTKTNAIDMEMSQLKSSSANQGNHTEETFKKPIGRRTVNMSHDITTDDFNASKANRNAELSIQYLVPNKCSSNMEMPSFVKPTEKSFKKPNNRQTVNEPHDISSDDIAIDASTPNPYNRTNEMSIQFITAQQRRKTLLQAEDMEMASPATGLQDMSLDNIQSNSVQKNFADKQPAVEKRSSRRQTILQDHDMDLDSPLKQSNEVMASSSKQQSRQTINKPHNISVDLTEKRPDTAKVFVPIRRQTTHTVHNISLDTPTTQPPRDNVRDISFDEIQSTDSPAVQHGNPNWKKSVSSTSRLTMNEPRDMSFDSNATGKSNVYSRYNKTILGDMSMELQSTDVYGQPNRKSVICKSPSKNATNTAFDRSSLEFTKLIDQNNLYDTIHSTKLYDKNCSKFSDFELNASAENSSDDNEIEQNGPPTQAAQGLVSFKQTSNQTTHGVYDLDISEDSSPISTAKKFNLNKTPYYVGLDVESDSSSLDLTANNFNDENLYEPKRIEQQAIASKQFGETKIFHATINDDNSHLSVASVASAQSIASDRVSPASIPLERPKSMNRVNLMLDNSKRSIMPNQSLFQLSSIGSPIQIDDSISTSHSSAPSNLVNVSIGANDSAKQLTFIEDDDDEEQICNTKIDLAISLETSDNESLIAGMIDIVKPIIASTSAMITSIDQSDQSLSEEWNAFKKSNRLRHSNVFESNKNRNDTGTSNDDSSNAAVHSKDSTLTDIGQSQIMQRRSNNATANDEANETSFLEKRPEKKASEVKLDFSGYDELAGLATPMDVFEDFLERMEQIDRQNEIWAEQYRKFEAGEIDNFDDDEDLNSQNVEAPSWTVLFKNKLQGEL